MVPSLATRATLAAWPSNGVHVTEHPSNLPSQNATPVQENEQGRYSVFIFNSFLEACEWDGEEHLTCHSLHFDFIKYKQNLF